ncbi:T9SS type A sorting domain-containing protein [Membranihabitans maritimus]|uniref:T9SS type A sorting domain-containing protein n=1 Tax=Membranihabitans maritimus TaxID=2904244 RepID=UPI001F2E5EF7|nr:T9SS type A sorting domain-containing protein [Membranihabitans maritimus]
MKNLSVFTTLLLVLLVVCAEGQSTKIPLVEHFSNTPCPICQGSRAGIYEDLAKVEGKVNHITFHRGSPYPDCELYLYNKSEQDNREGVYNNSIRGITGSPRLAVNGVPRHSSALASDIENALEENEVNVGLNMKEEGSTSRKVTLEVSNLTGTSMENLYVYAAMVEEEVNVNVDGTNYEIHDVFRKFLGDQGGSGNAVGALEGGATTEIVLDGSVPNDLSANNIYVVAWVENRVPDGDKYEIVTENSVSEKSSLLTSNNLEISKTELTISPNPASEYLNITNVSSFTPGRLKIYNISGKEVKSIVFTSQLSISDLRPGSYLLVLENEEHRVVRKFIKQ